MTGSYERASSALGLAKALSDLPESDDETSRKSRALQEELTTQGFLATQQFIGHATPVLTSHRQTWFFVAMIPVSFIVLTFNAVGLNPDTFAFGVAIGAILVVPMVFGVITHVVFGRVARYKDSHKSLEEATRKVGAKDLISVKSKSGSR
ncbi:hypothetical protein [Arthrobacter sp. PsM3]|uniref:hypothetical protein n=1 Tax=Arthrobacter sp. PsM3 TaxID=3030531 RepID=UPI00263AEADF|nr:hypothetical protein [Arthrobacter sp. PsM3]MDN4643887.1 hypothetical protein [Arthrobacter sp. PsM3]